MPKPKLIPSAMLDLLGQGDFRKVFELLHTGIALLSTEGNFLYCNKAFLEMFNLPADTVGKHVSDFFLTAEQGVMTTIRTRKPTFHISLTTTNEQGISFRYPMLDDDGNLQGVIIESISPSIGPQKMRKLLDTIHDLEEKSHYFEEKVRKKTGSLHTFNSIIGESAALMTLKSKGRRFAKSNEPILLWGESGTGKELVAQALHMASPRSDKPFVTVNCAALPAELMEAELFGYESGAFTGARSGGSKGKFELADTGTIFLDEIGELPLPMQAKLLRVLESGEIQKLAHRGQLHSDFRLIAATNRNLAQSVEAGTFREDLYHRLNILELVIPPLRDRVGDIPLLTRHFIELHVGPRRAREIQISNDLYRAFGLHPWNGNIRELKNVLTYALFCLEENETLLSTRHLPERFFRDLHTVEQHQQETEAEMPEQEPDGLSMSEASAQAERRALVNALSSTRYNKTLAARVLGISRNKLYKKMKEFNLLGPAVKEESDKDEPERLPRDN